LRESALAARGLAALLSLLLSGPREHTQPHWQLGSQRFRSVQAGPTRL